MKKRHGIAGNELFEELGFLIYSPSLNGTHGYGPFIDNITANLKNRLLASVFLPPFSITPKKSRHFERHRRTIPIGYHAINKIELTQT